MFPLWDLVIGPVIEAAGAHRVVEVGALRGETTDLMVGRLGPDAEVHVIDPAPDFDPNKHETSFPGSYVFHRDISHNVLPHLAPVDVALIDGDHNWYTVYHELRMLAEVSRAAGEPLPVLVMHDVGWPYGRRDQYYAPERIPEEFRQDHAQQGMRPGGKGLLPNGGFNRSMHNARKEGGPRNGVLTALEDFLAEHDRPVRKLVIPIYFGLAVVVEEERLAHHPELSALLDHLEDAEGRGELLELGESTRLRALLFQQNILRIRDEHQHTLTQRYLGMLKGALLDQHYLENEARLRYFARCHELGNNPGPPALREPARHASEDVRRVQKAQRDGAERGDVGAPFAYAGMGRLHLDAVENALDELEAGQVSGDLVECGTGRGGGGIFMRGWLAARGITDRSVFVADTFRAVPHDGDEDRPHIGVIDPANLAPDENLVRAAFDRFELLDERVRFLQGPPASTLVAAPGEPIALLRIGAGVDDAAGDILRAAYDRISVGGKIIVEGSPDGAHRAAVEAFRGERGLNEPAEPVGMAGLRWTKSGPAPETAPDVTPAVEGAHPPLAPPRPSGAADLSVIVVFYNMKREAVRTLQSLSPAYQQGVEDLDYEVIVVENGSSPDQRVGADLVRAFGPRFSYLDLGDDAEPSPVGALNCGMRLARGASVAFMIDGAHLLTPGVLHYGMAGLRTYEPAVVATQQWYVGPGQQPDTTAKGYDRDYEDRLFDQIVWPADGYRLFDIGHFVGDRDWLDGVWESNCLFAPRHLLEQVGGYDENFSMPGGGYANLELYERLGTSPGVTVVTVLGEGSFHQVHSGTTTNQADPAERHRRISSYGQHYAELRGRGFQGPGKPIHYIGSLRPSSRRTKARRLRSPTFEDVTSGGSDGRADVAWPLPQELAEDYLSALWHSHAWQEPTWMGHPVGKLTNDLFAYQELIQKIRPDWVIVTGTGDGGRSLFLASMCDVAEAGRVISVGRINPDQVPQHPRLTYFNSPTTTPKLVTKVQELVGDERALVILGSRRNPPQMAKEFDAFAPFVPSGSYVVVEDTVVNGHPIWPGFGPGPAEGVKRILREHGSDWVADPGLERFGVTFNSGGFLRRL